MERKIYAVHDRDLSQFLTDLRLLDKIAKGEIKCPECECMITPNNIGFITIYKGEAKLCCDNIECFYKLRTKINEGRRTNEVAKKEVTKAMEHATIETGISIEESDAHEA
jgi:hypothetical protein